MGSAATGQRSGSLAWLAILLALAVACSGGPSIPEPYGRRVTVEMVDGARVLCGDEELSLEDFAERMRRAVDAAAEGRTEPPRVELRCRPGIVAPGFVDRFVEAMQRAGVRAIDIET